MTTPSPHQIADRRSGGPSQRRIPRATYRVQFNPSFTFGDASAIIEYLADLGISDWYASPILRARANSTHGYDVCDHAQINPVLGGVVGFDQFIAKLHEHGLGLILDLVPNHMGIGDPANVWWMDVLENGPGSRYADFFDIEWRPVKRELENKVLLPILEDQYGVVLEQGKLRVSYEDGTFRLHYYDHVFPLAPRSYRLLLAHTLECLAAHEDATTDESFEIQSIMTALDYLPPRARLDPDQMAERYREKEIVKRRLVTLYTGSATVRAAIAATIEAFNGQPAEPSSYDLLHALIDDQAYRLAFWRVAAEEINYRRFFDINELAAIRVERPDVFEATHRVVLDLMAQGTVTGFRIDHIDGLADPIAYLRQLHYQVALERGSVSVSTAQQEVCTGRDAQQSTSVATLSTMDEMVDP